MNTIDRVFFPACVVSFESMASVVDVVEGRVGDQARPMIAAMAVGGLLILCETEHPGVFFAIQRDSDDGFAVVVVANAWMRKTPDEACAIIVRAVDAVAEWFGVPVRAVAVREQRIGDMVEPKGSVH